MDCDSITTAETLLPPSLKSCDSIWHLPRNDRLSPGCFHSSLNYARQQSLFGLDRHIPALIKIAMRKLFSLL